jgi:hypothetical protein
MNINWKKIEDRFEEIDNDTHGLAAFFLIGGAGSILTIGLYCMCAAVIYGYAQIFNLITA